MATNQTTNYQLNQWESTDAVQRVDFNADNAKVDAALETLSDQIVQKANQSTLNTVISAVNQKADASVVTALSSTVAGHTSQLAQKGNCQMVVTSYTGSGDYGEDSKNSLTFDVTPWLILITDQTNGTIMTAAHGQPRSWARASGAVWNMFTWSGNKVSWYSTSDESQMNLKGVVYQVIMLSKTD